MFIYVYSLIGLTGIFLAGGIFFIIRGMRENSSKEIAVPISNFEEIRDFKMDFSSSAQSVKQNPRLTHHILNENLASSDFAEKRDVSLASQGMEETASAGIGHPLGGAVGVGEDVHSTVRLVALEKECQRLKEALGREISSKDLRVMSQEENSRFEELSRNLNYYQTMVESLTQENQKLKARQIQQDTAYQELEQSFKIFRDQQEQLMVRNQDAIAKISERAESAEQLIQADSMRGKTDLEKLTQENQEFRRVMMEAKEETRQSHLMMEKAKVRAEQLEVQLRELRVDLQARQISLEQEQGDRILQLQKVIQQLEFEKDGILKRQTQLQSDYNRINTMNGQLLEKGKILQYELTKHRAQALGLEKICEDFRWQMERGSGADSKVSVV